MDIVYHVSEVTFLLLAGGLVFWVITQDQNSDCETAKAPVCVQSDDPFRR